MIIKALRKFLWTLFFSSGFLIAVLVFVSTTELGTATVFNLLTKLTDKKFSYSQVNGTLLNDLTLQNLRYSDADISIKIQYIHLNWYPYALLQKKLQVNKLVIKDVIINTHSKNNNSGAAPPSFWLPAVIEFNELAVNNVVLLSENSKKLVIKNLTGRVNIADKLAVNLVIAPVFPIASTIQINAKGFLKAYEWSIHALSAGYGDWVVIGNGNLLGTQFVTRNSNFYGGLLAINGFINWQPKLVWKLDIAASKLNAPGLQLKNISFGLTSAGSLSAFNLFISKLQGVYAGSPVSGFISLNALLPTPVVLEKIKLTMNANLRWGVLTAFIKGYLNKNWAVDFSIKTTEIHKIFAKIQGSLTLVGFLKGAATSPILNAELTSPRLTIADFNLHLLQTHLHFTATKDLITYQGSSRSGAGQMQLTGKSNFKHAAMLSAITITGKDFLVSNTPTIKVAVSPSIKITNPNGHWSVTGIIDVPNATLGMPTTNEVITLPPETVIVGGATANQTPSNIVPIFSDILIKLGTAVNVDAKGFVGNLGGQVEVKTVPDAEPTATGVIRINQGSYDLRGDKLTIDKGAITFANSPLSNPRLAIQASKTIKFSQTDRATFNDQNLQLGILVSGTADNPIVKFFSNPAGWSQADILSLILLGQPASAGSSANLQLLMRAVQALKSNNSSMGSVGSLQQNLQQSLGLSEFKFVSGINNQGGTYQQSSAFVLGKTLTPRLTVSYSLNVLNSINVFRLRYLLRKNWFLQSDSSTQGVGADIFYSIKK